MTDILRVCDVSPVLPLIGIALSALALLVTLRLLLRLMALEMRRAVAKEIAGMDYRLAEMKPGGDGIMERPDGYRRAVRRNGYRLILILPSLLLLLGCSTLLYMTNIDDCNITDQGSDEDGGT